METYVRIITGENPFREGSERDGAEEILRREALNWLDRKEGLRLRQPKTPSALPIEPPTAVREPFRRRCRLPLQRFSFPSFARGRRSGQRSLELKFITEGPFPSRINYSTVLGQWDPLMINTNLVPPLFAVIMY